MVHLAMGIVDRWQRRAVRYDDLMDLKVILVGGTSHAGKSTLAEALAAPPEWETLSTDKLARHPGRPWREEGRAPAFVRDYYLSRTTDELVDEVWAHYESNVWPIAEAILHARLSNPFDRCLVLEGSAVLPELVSRANQPRVLAVWFTAPDELLAERIRRSSGFTNRSPEDRELIDRFQNRTLAFNRRLEASARSLGLRLVDTSTDEATRELKALLHPAMAPDT